MQFTRRVGAYGLVRDSGRVLMVRDGAEGEFPGFWRLPGGAVGHAEDPEHAVVRQVAEQAGLTIAVARLLAVVADVATFTEDKAALHTDRLLFELNMPQGALSDGAGPESVGPENAGPEGAAPERAGLEGAGLEGAGLEGAGLEGAGLEGAGLEGAGLEGAGLEGAGLEGAGLEGAGLEGAGLEGAGRGGRGA
ncbi:NUDIX domain-containing protein [Micromonospora alfalfae]|uniref:NUDIX domain-containing protein n=1 Tax=Micromonospora alfalfae TaxID=2911212 RepID=UPI0027E1347E|nr:NUDIX domain-containing protein [Micromonospora alfalfae]